MLSLIEWNFLCCVSEIEGSFLVLHFDGNVCTWIPKVIWPWTDWFCGFLFKKGFFRLLHIFMDWNLKKMLNCLSFWQVRILPMFKLRGILVCSLKMLVLFSYRVLQYWLRSLRNAMQLHFLSFCVNQLFCPGSSGETLWLLLKPK